MFCANCPNWDICPENRTGRIGCDIDMSDDFGYAGVEDSWYDEYDEIGDQYIPSGMGSYSQ